jgi:hypothetical protein
MTVGLLSSEWDVQSCRCFQVQFVRPQVLLLLKLKEAIQNLSWCHIMDEVLRTTGSECKSHNALMPFVTHDKVSPASLILLHSPEHFVSLLVKATLL